MSARKNGLWRISMPYLDSRFTAPGIWCQRRHHDLVVAKRWWTDLHSRLLLGFRRRLGTLC